MSELPKIIVILGPTASGKSDVGLAIAKKFNGEIVSADSRTVYRGMDIGTAKPACDVEDKRSKIKDYKVNEVRHHLIDVVEPDEEFSLANFKEKANAAIKDILRRGKLPIIIGGTGLYIQTIVDNLDIPKVAPDKMLRAELEEKSLEELQTMLAQIDEEAYGKIDLNNPRRLIRALEIAIGSGESVVKQQTKSQPLYDVLQIGLNWPREELYKRINARVDKMMADGLLEETRRLFGILSSRGAERRGDLLVHENNSVVEGIASPDVRRGRNDIWNLPSLSGIGYRQMGYYLRGEMTLEQAVEKLKQDTRHYAKRQMTWFSAHGGSASGGKRDQRISWVEKNNLPAAERLVGEFVR